MTRQNISTGTTANDGTGDALRSAATKINANFVEIYQKLGGDSDIMTTQISMTTDGIVFEGTTANDFETTLKATDPTADRTITLPNANGTVSLVTGTETLTNKTLTSPILNGPILSAVQIQDTSSDHQYIITPSELSADRTITLPALTGNDELTFNAATQTLTNKRLNSPKIGTAITDTNGNESIEIVATGSAVNHIRVTNSATGSGPTISAVGGDTNANLNVSAKGTGTIIAGSRIRFKSYTTTARNALSPQNGDVIYNETDNKFQGYANGSWVDLH
jgi:hypothetical protein